VVTFETTESAMKRIIIIFGIFCALFISGSFAQTLNWSQTSGPYNSSVHSFLSVGNIIYSGISEGSGQGLYKSTDEGNSWIVIDNGFIINDISTDGKGTLYAGGSRGVTVSSDAGNIWSVRDTGFPLFAIAYAVKYINGSVYACLGDDGLYKSTDDGKSWSIPGNATGKIAYSIIASGSNLIVSAKYGTIISTNNGLTWEEPINDLSGASIHTIVKSGSALFAGTDMGVFRSDDNGLTWSASSIGIPSYAVISSLVFSTDGKTMFAGNLEGELKGLYRSDDTGKTWHFLYNDMWGASINSLTTAPSGILAGTDLGIFRSENNGDSWKSSSSGFPKVKITALASDNPTLFAGSSNSYLFSTNDKGEHWEIHKEGLSRPNIRSLLKVGSQLFAGTDAKPKEGKGGIFRSSDNGKTWVQLSGGLPIVGFNALLDHGALFAGADTGVYTSTDNGDHWSYAGFGISDTVLALGAIGNTIAAGTTNGLYLSTNNGYSWSYELSSFGKKKIYSFTTSGINTFIGSDSGIYLSTDNAQSWKLVSEPMDVRSIWSNSFIIAAGATSGIYLSSNNGTTWQSQTSAAGILINSFSSANKQLYAATNTGIMKAPLGQFTKVNNISISNGLSLQVINSSPSHSQIRFQISNPGNISINVSDLLGKQLKTLVQEFRNAGEYNVPWNTSEIASGIYMITLISGKEIITSAATVIH
jgi:photosystem II stability/assembly factor-like uncharacterized protein